MSKRSDIGLDQSGRSAPPLLRTLLGERLRRARLAQRRTLADVARAARVSMPYLSELERGRKEASSEVLAAICAALGVPLAQLLTELGHDLAEQQRHPSAVLRLDSLRRHRPRAAAGEAARPQRPGCLLHAA